MTGETLSFLAALAACLFGSGGIVLWFLERAAKRLDRRDTVSKDLGEIKDALRLLEDGLVMSMENDKVIFRALRTHEINGDSEEQERKMDEYFISLIRERDKG